MKRGILTRFRQVAQTTTFNEATNASGVPQADYIYLDGQPIVVVNGYAQQVGDDYMDPFYRQAFDQLNNPANKHGNGIVTNNCKTETKKLGQRANQLFNNSPLGQLMQMLQAMGRYAAGHTSY